MRSYAVALTWVLVAGALYAREVLRMLGVG
jgi:hypothetical protein